MSKSLIFSGQGSQYVGMLSDFYTNCDISKSLINKANEILNYNLANILIEGPIDLLTETRYTQPALFLHSAVIFNLIRDKVNFSAVAGHSVGEYAALLAAEVISFEDALLLVAERGRLMFEIGQEIPGTMFAVVGMEDNKLIEITENLNVVTSELDKVIIPANFNSPGQIVISGSRDYLREKIAEFKTNGAKITKELVVSGAFHSPLMEPVKNELDKKIDAVEFRKAKYPIYMNVTGTATTDPIEIKENLKQQVVSPVYWTQTLTNMFNEGLNEFTEVGPSNVLQGLVKRTLKDVKISGLDKLNQVVELLS